MKHGREMMMMMEREVEKNREMAEMIMCYVCGIEWILENVAGMTNRHIQNEYGHIPALF